MLEVICDATCQNQALLPKMGFRVTVLLNKRVPLALFMFLGHTNPKLCILVNATVAYLYKREKGS